ncbi:LysR family transcriptional regulator [Streptomyces lushanensis]|uniref:LysR family transcriptional regulator n=1 Tax=Streptomyces lushanensis TaxID=1434255 RepID=UPI00082B438E|nr:LysR substrate-binding domain-containing protein [Streptomyces lushanensis]
MDVDLRKIRYFVAVAERLHFGRAAEELHIAQPVLSRQIKALESDLKVRLFRRDRRGTELTPAGEQLLADARPLLASAAAMRRRAVRAARVTDTFTVGFMPGLIVTDAVRTLAGRHPGLDIDVVRTSWEDQADVVRDGRVDVGYVRMPIDPTGVETVPLLTEQRVVVLPGDHPLSGKESVGIADLADEHLLQNPDAVPEWRDLVAARGGRERRSQPLIRTTEEKLEQVAARRGVVVLPLSTALFYTRPDICHVPVDDIPPSHVRLAWAGGRHRGLVEEFTRIALDSAGRGRPGGGSSAPR